MFDSHLHLRDPRILPYHARFVKEAIDLGVTGCIDCAVRPEDWNAEVRCALDVTTAFGLHPWSVATACPDWADFLECALRAAPGALVGEIGLDGIRKTLDGGAAQRDALALQLALAARLGRPVVLHGARAWGALLHALEPWANKLPAILLHGVSFSPDLLRHPILSRPNVWFSVGGALLSPPPSPSTDSLSRPTPPTCFPSAASPSSSANTAPSSTPPPTSPSSSAPSPASATSPSPSLPTSPPTTPKPSSPPAADPHPVV